MDARYIFEIYLYEIVRKSREFLWKKDNGIVQMLIVAVFWAGIV